MANDTPLIRVMALHALAYCERLFYLEEVEEIRLADHRVYAGRTLHAAEVEKDAEWGSITLGSEGWGLKGKVDYARYRDGKFIAYEHKRGRSKGDEAWASDRLQVIAYCALLSEHLDKPVNEGRIRYHANNRTIKVMADETAWVELKEALVRARELSSSVDRPPVTDNENLCVKCSLAPVCLPEEERLLHLQDEEGGHVKPERLFPADDERRIVHVTEPGTRAGRSGEQIVITPREGEAVKLPGRDVSSLVLHGGVQISTQLIHYCAAHDITVHWVTGGGNYVGAVAPPGGVQRRVRQYRSLCDEKLKKELTRRLVAAKVENQLAFLSRTARSREVSDCVTKQVNGLRAELRSISRADTVNELRGHEGMAGRLYFSALPSLIDSAQTLMQVDGRNRRPPQDAFNAALSFGYSLLYREMVAAILTVGLDPALGFFHAARSAAYPLALDMMELFRVLMWDLVLIGSINRKQWRDEHFETIKQRVWLHQEGRKLAIGLYESRKQDRWKHPVLEYSLSYARTLELEARLLEKEWSGSPGLFAKLRLR